MIKVQKKNKNERCLYPKCKREVHARGLCSLHYQYANIAVRRKYTTWHDLEKAGKVKPRKLPGRHVEDNVDLMWFKS